MGYVRRVDFRRTYAGIRLSQRTKTNPNGNFTSRLISNRTIITATPRMLISSLIQYNADEHSLSASVRLNWEYQPSSQVFVVYSDGRDTLGPGVPDLFNRSFALKITRLLRF